MISSLSIVFPERAKYIKAFAEYENLPHKDRFNPNIPSFLYNLGVKPVNPFVAYSRNSGKENKNASDIALSLEVVSDILIKKNPIDLIIIASGDIDLYPLVSWIREYTDKEIFIASFENRLNNIYKQVLDFFAIEKNKFITSTGNIWEEEIFKYLIFLEKTVKLCFKDIVLSIIRNNIKLGLDEKSLRWLQSNINKLILSRKIRLYGKEKDILSEFLKKDFKEFKKEKNINEEEINLCEKFKEKLIKGLKKWLKSHNEATTGLIIKSWFPTWKIGISEDEANKCLKSITKDIEKYNFEFEGDTQDSLVIGKFRLKN